MPITVTPVFPDRTLGPALFEPAADQFYRDIVTAVPQMNALEVNVNAKEVSATSAAAAATTKASEAAASAQASAASANAPAWSSGTTYGAGDVRFSPATFQSYRRKATGAGTTDPSADTTNWQSVSQAVLVSGTNIRTVNGASLLGGTDILVQAPLVSGTNIKTVSGISLLGSGDIALGYREFQKSDYTQAWIGKTGAFALAVTSDAWVEVNGIWTFVASGTAATMPGSPVAGTDYALWVKTGGVLEVTNSFTSPPVAGSRLVGGFHYAPGGNATGASGGDSTPAINAYSAWDLKWRPSSDDVRGQHLVGGGFWGDIYITGVDHIVNGTSKYNVTIADGSNPPRIPVAFGGNGTAVYGSYNWWEAAEVLFSHGKRLPTYMEYCALAYGVTEATSRGSDPGTTGLDAARTSKWGTMQATGNMYIWGADLGGPYAAAGWVATPGTRGSTYNLPSAVLFGGYWAGGALSGSRYSDWTTAPSSSSYIFGSRGVSDHLKLV